MKLCFKQIPVCAVILINKKKIIILILVVSVINIVNEYLTKKFNFQ